MVGIHSSPDLSLFAEVGLACETTKAAWPQLLCDHFSPSVLPPLPPSPFFFPFFPFSSLRLTFNSATQPSVDTCTGVPLDNTVTFNVTVTLTSCDAFRNRTTPRM